MAISPEQIKVLLAGLNPARVKNRSQGGRSLSYLEAYDVKATLIRVFGFAGFSAEVTQAQILRMAQDVPAYTGSRNNRTRKTDEDGNPAFNWSVAAQCTVRLEILSTGAVYTESAVASQVGPDIGEVADFAVKTAESDALKRAATYLGTQFGLSLYAGQVADIVKVVVEPEQAAMLAPPEPPSAELQEAVARATGQVEDPAAQERQEEGQ